MLCVTDLNGNTEPLNHIQRVEKDEEVNGGSTLSLTSFFHENNPGHDLIDEEAVIHADGHDYRIKQLKENKGRKEAVAIHTFFDVAGTWKHEIYGGTRSFEDFANFTFSGTGWTVEIEGVFGVAFIANFGNHNIIQLVQTLCSVYECDYQILPGKRVLFAKQIGPDNDAQYRYGHNVKALSKSVDTTNLFTKIKGYGIDGVEVVHTSPNAEKYGIYEAEPIYDEEYSAEMMSERLTRELTDYPEVIFDMDVVELLDKALGERIWLIYEPMNIEFQTRILAKKSTWRNGKFITESITIGNVKRKTLSDILASTKIEIDENARQTRSRIEQTNTNITLAVEEFAGEILKAYGKIEITASEIRQEVADVESGLYGTISLTATQIRSEVADVKSGLSSQIAQTASEIRAEILAADQKVEDGIANNSSLITQTASSIRSEVNSEIKRVDGRIDTANSSITQTASSIRSEVATSVSSLDGKITSANSSITQLSNRIDLKAESTVVSNLGSRVNSVEFSMDAANAEITQKVSKTDYNGNTLVSMINQTPSHIKISAPNIELTGAVTVLSDISGKLGNITAGNIDISEDMKIGAGLYLRGPGVNTGIYFGSSQIMQDTTGYLNLSNRIRIGSFTEINGQLDLTRANVSWGNNRPAAVWG